MSEYLKTPHHQIFKKSAVIQCWMENHLVMAVLVFVRDDKGDDWEVASFKSDEEAIEYLNTLYEELNDS